MANSAIRAPRPPSQQASLAGRAGFLWIALGLAVANFAVYWGLTGYQFLNFDDDWYVVNNTSVAQGFSWEGVRWAFTALDYFYWQPLTWLSHMLDCQLFGLNAGSHHFTNILIHVINTLLVFALFRRITGLTARSGTVAALFSLHPLAVESVAWIAERKNVLSGFFCLLTMWAYVHYVEQPSAKRYRWLFLAFIGGLMAKPMLLTLPFALLALDYWPLHRPEWGSRQGFMRLAGEKVPLLMLSALSGIVTYIGVKKMGALDFLAGVSMSTRIANALYSYVRYLALTIWPMGLNILNPYDQGLPLWKGVASGVALIALTLAAFRLRKSKPYLLAGLAWFVVILLPMVGLVQAGRQDIADRFMYIPLTGLCVALVWLAGDALASRPRIAFALAAVAVVACASSAWVQAGYWKDSVTIFQRTVDVTCNNTLAEYHLASALQENGQFEQAIAHFREAIRIEPSFYPAYYDLGSSLAARGKPEEAAGPLRMAVRYKPDHSGAYYRLGTVLVATGRPAEAVEPFREALRLGLKPELAVEARKNIDLALMQQLHQN
jgi:tetratricopeptide (TPR) repeat protein